MAATILSAMRFCCPKCGREDEVIGDTKPNCLWCGTALLRAETYTGLWMSPRIAVVRMNTLIEKHGYGEATTSGRFKREREAWTTGMYALGLAEMYSKEYWVEIETVDQTPDTRVHHIDQSAGHNEIETQHIEIVDWEEHVDDALDLIKQKCRRAYPPYFCLLLLARNGQNFDVGGITREIRNVNIPFAEIWVLGRISDEAMTLLRLVPSSMRADFDITDALEKGKRQGHFMVRQKRGASTEFRDLGPTFLPIP